MNHLDGKLKRHKRDSVIEKSNHIHASMAIRKPSEAAEEAFHRPLYHLRKNGEKDAD